MKDQSTKEITSELLQREGISHIEVEPHEKVTITTGTTSKNIEGPAIIVINQD